MFQGLVVHQLEVEASIPNQNPIGNLQGTVILIKRGLIPN
jgi:hypothetical protein